MRLCLPCDLGAKDGGTVGAVVGSVVVEVVDVDVGISIYQIFR